MASYPNLKVLRVFLASPGDLTQERKVARRVVDELNLVFARTFNWQIDLYGWEDTLPGSGRPQELINKEVSECHLFVGLLWRRWGQPTGEYSSGFEEEFELARGRRSRSQEPEIWLCFKEVERAQTRDPGEQLARVLAFRRQQIEARDLLFKEFRTPEDWERDFRNWLLEYVADLVQSGRSAPTVPSERPSANPQTSQASVAEVPKARSEQSEESIPTQLLGTMEGFSEAIRAGELDLGAGPSPNIEEFQIVRLGLCSQTFFSMKYPSIFIDSHMVHVLYRNRDRVDFAPRERVFVFRSLIADHLNLIPGWYWFRIQDNQDLMSTAPATFLPVLAARDRAVEVRTRSYKLLDSVPVHPEPGSKGALELLQAVLSEENDRARRAGLEFLSNHGTREDVAEIERAEGEVDGRERAALAAVRFRILARADPTNVLTEMLDASEGAEDKAFDYVHNLGRYEIVLGELQRGAFGLDFVTLRRMLAIFDPSVRQFAVRELVRRNGLSREDALSSLGDKSADVRVIALKHLAVLGSPYEKDQFEAAIRGPENADAISPEETARIKLEFFEHMSPEELEARIYWYSVDGSIAYKAKGFQYFGEAGPTIRRDLEETFQTLRESSAKRMADRVGDAFQEIADSYKNLEAFINTQFTAAALTVLAVKGERSDVRFARALVAERVPDVQIKAVEILGKWGDSTDAGLLLTVARNSTGELKLLSAQAALEMDGSCVETLLGSADRELATVCLRWLRDRGATEGLCMKLHPLLLDDDDQMRERALSVLSERLGTGEMEELLKTYTENATYYYDVVCWLDRILYSPPPLRDFFRSELAAKLDR